jgi:hypothetical protein
MRNRNGSKAMTEGLRRESRRSHTATLAALTLLATVAVCDGADEAARPATPPKPEIEITSTKTSWDNLSELFFSATPAAPFGEGSVFVMRGEIRNATSHPVHHVVLRYELLDANGKVLHDVEGFNRSAESMRPDEEGAVHAEKVTPIPAGGTDSYRMVFFHDEVPRFVSQRVRVSEVHEK